MLRIPFATSLLWLSLSALTLTACGGSSSSTSGGGGGSGEPSGRSLAEPAFETDIATLNEAIVCNPFTQTGPIVLLVHGTFTHGEEHWGWTYEPLLLNEGHDVCLVTYPNRGLGDAQIAAEYVVNAIDQLAATGRKVSIIGHSQGGMPPRWAVRFWPSLRDKIDDMILLAAPNHGIVLAELTALTELGVPIPIPAVFYQFRASSNYMTAVNTGDETPGDIDYTNMYTVFDELVQPVLPEPSSALDWQQNNPKVANILLQDICPGRIAEHGSVMADAAVFELVLDALAHPGPANPERVSDDICGLLPRVPELVLSPTLITDLLEVLASEPAQGLPNLSLTTEEPPLKPYAQLALPEEE